MIPNPVVETIIPGSRLLQISPVAFLLQFTSQERIAIRVLRTKANIDGDPMQEAAMAVDDWMRIVEDPRLTIIDLTLPATHAGLDFLVQLGILTPERADTIKAGIPA